MRHDRPDRCGYAAWQHFNCEPVATLHTLPQMRFTLGLLAIAVFVLTACSSRGGADNYSPPPAMMTMLPPVQSDPCSGVSTRGRCLDSMTVQSCLVDQRGRAVITKVNCSTNEVCATEGNESFCKLTAPCRDGLSRCSVAGAERCISGRWSATSCPFGEACMRFPGAGVQCVPTGSSVFVTGRLQYQYRRVRADLLGFESTYSVANARRVLVLVAESGKLLGSGYADDLGQFSVPTYRLPGPTAQLLFLPVMFYQSDAPAFAVSQPSGSGYSDHRSSPAVWSFSASNLPPARAGRIDTGTWLITGEGAGALHIYDWVLYGFDNANALFGRFPQTSIALLWSPTHTPACGACFRSRAFGGTDVGSGAAHLDTSIELGGTAASPGHWATSVINHEFGHYVMNEFSKSPREGGAHGLGMLVKPGMAWSEGFATFSGQATLTRAVGSPQPLYFDVQGGTAFWVDISRGFTADKTLSRPNPNGQLDQPLDEFVLSGMLWDLRNTYGDATVFRGMTTARLTGTLNRGDPAVDLIDYADGLACDGLVSVTGLTNVLRYRQQYPWDERPLCR